MLDADEPHPAGQGDAASDGVRDVLDSITKAWRTTWTRAQPTRRTEWTATGRAWTRAGTRTRKMTDDAAGDLECGDIDSCGCV